jgi:CheY-like chemotaxis protein
MSHEIRTPLNAVLGFAQILERDESLTAKQARFADSILRSGRHLLDLINDILSMSRIEAGQLPLKKVDFCLHDLLDDLEMMFRSRALAKGLQLIVERREDVPRYVHADEGKLRQILINLLGNAVKFTELGGVGVRVWTAAREDKAGDQQADLDLFVEVEDTGPGIPPEDLESIFNSFQQSETGTEAGGTGLGLAISWQLADLMCGELTVQSQMGKGSCFRLQAPVTLAAGAVKKASKELKAVAGLEPGTGPYRILAADDQKDNLDLIAAMLEPIGFEVKTAKNGQEAVDLFEGWSPHAVLMDMRMPVMDGYEATRRIKATIHGRSTPVIAVTASVFEDEEKGVLEAGVDCIVRKPFRPEGLFEALRQCLDLHYVYAADAGQPQDMASAWSLGSDDLNSLPADLIKDMYQAVLEGDVMRLGDLIAQAEAVDADVGRKLHVLAEHFDYQKLSKVLQPEGNFRHGK